MPRYNCRYISAGTRRACMIEAASAAEAAEKMRRLPWGPGCGPVGAPRRRWSALPMVEVVFPVLLAGILAMSALLIESPESEFRQTAAVTDEIAAQ